jgi:putative ABC transport system substrate-binding protein
MDFDQLKRRELAALVCGAAAARPFAARAQGNPIAPRVGYVFPGRLVPSRIDVVTSGVRDAAPGVTRIEMVVRATDGDPARIVPLVSEVIGSNVSVFIAAGPACLRAAQQATHTVPIVAYDFETDPVAERYAQSIARPGGNVTGIFLDVPDFAGKWIEFLRECLPGLERIALLWDPGVGRGQVDSLSRIAASLGIKTDVIEIKAPDDFTDAFAVARDRGSGAAALLSSPLVATNTTPLADLSLRQRLPSITLFADFARSGGLISYGPNLLAVARQAGSIAGRILGGANPATLPIDRPSKFEMAINLKTARALGLTVPPVILAGADEVIE